MSWDVLVFHAPPEIETVEQMGDDFHTVLGPRDEVLGRLRELFPEIDLSDPTWGDLEGPGYSIELNIGDKDPVESIMLHVRGGAEAIEPMRRLCEATGWRAMDMGDCEFLDFDEDPARGLRDWQELLGQAIEEAEISGGEVVADAKIGAKRVDAVAVPRRRKPWWRFWE